MLKSKDSKHLVFLVFIVSLVLLFSLTDCNANEINETNQDSLCNIENLEENYNSINEISVSGNTFADIQQAITNAHDGDVIILDKERYYGNGVSIIIDKQINIYGKGANDTILDGNCNTSILKIKQNGNNVIIKNCAFINGKAIRGGAIEIGSQNVQIINCTFKYNEAIVGGAIATEYGDDPLYIVGRNLKILNCYFYDNLATEYAGAVGAYGFNNEIKNCVFDSNRAYGKIAIGGAIQVGKLEVNSQSKCLNCLFINNSAINSDPNGNSHGGAGCLREGTEYNNCTFIGNKASFGGALLYHAAGIVSNCTFENNVAFESYGGALSTTLDGLLSDLVVKDSKFKGNIATTGGACFLKGTGIEINNCEFEDNLAYTNGGGINIESSSSRIISSIFNGNIANKNGGGMYIDANSVLVQYCLFDYNEAIPQVKMLDDGLGGAIYINSSQSGIYNNSFKFNVARNGSAVYIDKYATSTIINDNNMVENQAWIYSLPVFVDKSVIFYGETADITSIIYGGNNIANSSNIEVSNAIYNNALVQTILVDGINPIFGANNQGILYQDDREYNIAILLEIIDENGGVVFNNTLYSDVYGKVELALNNLEPGNYKVYATHFEDNYYKALINETTFTVLPKADIQINKSSINSQYNYKDVILWNLTITNNGPNKATEIAVLDSLPDGLIWIGDNSNGRYDPVTGIFNLSDLESSQSYNLIIYTQINKTGVIVNVANISAKEYDYDINNNHDFESIFVNYSADLEVTEKFSQKNPNYGDEILLVILAKNNGPDNANNVKVNITIPEGLEWIIDDSNGLYDPNGGIWNLNKLNKGESKVLTIKLLVNKTGKLTSNISIKGEEYDWNLDNNQDSDLINVSSAADLEVIKTVNNSNPNYLDAIKWTITVKNNGPDNATGVVLKDTLPEGLVILTINHPDEFKNGIWNVGTLDNGETKELIIYCRVNKTGKFENFVTVEGNEYDKNKDNNNDSESILVNSASDLEVIKTVDNKFPKFGDIVHWRIEVKNNGPDIATGIEVSEILPDGLTFIRSSESKGIFDYSKGLWKINSIGSFSSHFLDIYCKVDKTGTFTNKVSVRGNEYDFDNSNNEASETIIVDKAIDLAIEVIVNNSNPNYHDIVSIKLVAKNKGPDDATDVNVLSIVSDGLTLLNGNMLPNFNNGVWNIGNLDVGETKTLNLKYYVVKTGTINKLATINGTEFEINLDDNKDSKVLNINPAADLSISKTSSKLEYFVGDLINYKVNIVNNGPDAAHNIKVNDILDEGMSFISYSANMGTFDENGSVWMLDQLENGQMATLTFTSLANKIGKVLNKVSVIADEYDYNNDNNFDELAILVKNNVISASEYKLGDELASNSILEMEKTGSPVTILIMVLSILISFASGYFKKN